MDPYEERPGTCRNCGLEFKPGEHGVIRPNLGPDGVHRDDAGCIRALVREVKALQAQLKELGYLRPVGPATVGGRLLRLRD